MFTIFLIGAGQHGSRYLQGFVASKFVLEIFVVDPSLDALNTAEARWIEVGGNTSVHRVCFVQSLPSDATRADVVFVATSAGRRADLVEKISKVLEVNYWVFEKVLAQSSLEVNRIQGAVRNRKGAWVNTSRRMMPWHQSLKSMFVNKGPLKVCFSGGLWGLACNSVHFIDLVAWWSGEELIGVETRGLSQCWHQSKRVGYFEITGELIAHFSSGTSLYLNSKMGAEYKPIAVELNDGVSWQINEIAGTASSSNFEQFNGRVDYQSQLSKRLVEEILEHGKCELPLINEASKMHVIFLDAMLAHWNLSQGRLDDLLPIT